MSTRRLFDPDPADKPSKPYDDFPLFAHANGCWVKKIRGKLHYFGIWADPDGALKKYLEEKDDLLAGRKPRLDPAPLTIKDLCNHYLNAKQVRVQSGELSPRTWEGYKESCDAVVLAFGKGRLVADITPDDFAALRDRLAQRLGPHRLGTLVKGVRSLFRHAYDAELIRQPMRSGAGFSRPS